MNILVCISRTPDTTTKVIIGPDGKTIDPKGVKFIVNPYDEFALEEGLRLREKNGGNLTAITVGSEAGTDVLRTALAVGADTAVLVKGNELPDSYSAAYNIAEYAKKMNPDLILLGRQSIDYDSFQMGSYLAELLDIPSVSVVSKLTIDGSKVLAERDIEGGRELVETSLPCVISTQKGINEPRYPKLPDIMKAKKKPIEEIAMAPTETKTTVISMELPLKQRVGKILGDSDSDIDELVRALKEDQKII